MKSKFLKYIIYLTIAGFFTFFVINILIIDTTSARPGGGHSYSNGSNSSN